MISMNVKRRMFHHINNTKLQAKSNISWSMHLKEEDQRVNGKKAKYYIQKNDGTKEVCYKDIYMKIH